MSMHSPSPQTMTLQQHQPECVYCDEEMRIFHFDHTQDPAPLALFRCNSCGWEAMVPVEMETVA